MVQTNRHPRHYDGDRLTGYHIEPPEPDHNGSGIGLRGKFTLTFPNGESSETYDTFEEAQAAGEQLYQLDPIELPPPAPPWSMP